MGQIFCKGSDEDKKDTALFDPSSAPQDALNRGIKTVSDEGVVLGGDGMPIATEEAHLVGGGAVNDLADHGLSSAKQLNDGVTGVAPGGSGGAFTPGEQIKKLREEQARLELIVQNAGRGMVAVRSTRGSTGYYDQGFAAALAQHLEQTTQFPDRLPIRLPPINSANNNGNANNRHRSGSGSGSGLASGAASGEAAAVYARLSQPQWEGIALGPHRETLAGCGGESPNTYMDHIAVMYLDSIAPKKERMFAVAGPMVENLI